MRLFHRPSSHLPLHDHRHRRASEPHLRSCAELQLIADHHRDLDPSVTARRSA